MLDRLRWWLYADKFYADPWQHRLFPQHRWLLRRIKLHRPKTILEVGCGFGRNLQFLIDNGIRPSQLTGVDFLPKLLQHINLKVKLHRASAQNLPFPDHKFDLSFTHGLLMHIREPWPALAEIIRVSRHRIIIIEETRTKPGQLNSFTWAHDYRQLFRSLAVKISGAHHNQYHISGYEIRLSR
jgi:SAM-dependent methyltransferase